MPLEDILSGQRDDVTPALRWLRDRLSMGAGDVLDALPATSKGVLGAGEALSKGLRYLRDKASPAAREEPFTQIGALDFPTAAPRASARPALPGPSRRPTPAPTAGALPETSGLQWGDASMPTGSLTTPQDSTKWLDPGLANQGALSAFEPRTREALPVEFAREAPAAPRQTLEEKFKEAIAKLPKEAKGQLTDEQKRRLELEFFLGMMARSSKPGAYMLGAAGESGLDVAGKARADEEKNLAHSEKALGRQREDVYRSVLFGDKDEDNRRADQRTAAEERRWQAGEKRLGEQTELERERIGILRKQMEQGKWQVVNNAKTGTIVMYDADTGNVKDTGIKYDRKDERPAEVQLIEHAMRNPKFLETLIQVKGKEGGITEKDLLSAYSNAVRNDMGNAPPTFQEWRARSGFGGAGATTQKPDPAANKGKFLRDTETGKRYQSDGKQWVEVK